MDEEFVGLQYEVFRKEDEVITCNHETEVVTDGTFGFQLETSFEPALVNDHPLVEGEVIKMYEYITQRHEKKTDLLTWNPES